MRHRSFELARSELSIVGRISTPGRSATLSRLGPACGVSPVGSGGRGGDTIAESEAVQ